MPPELVFFLDRSVGKHAVAKALRSVGEQVELHDEHFAQNATDETWLKLAGERGWVVITKDSRIRRNDIERTALVEAGVRAFVISGKHLTGPAMGELVIAVLPKIKRLCTERLDPFIASLLPSGVRILFSADEGPRQRR